MDFILLQYRHFIILAQNLLLISRILVYPSRDTLMGLLTVQVHHVFSFSYQEQKIKKGGEMRYSHAPSYKKEAQMVCVNMSLAKITN